MKNTKDKIPADANWNQVISEVSDLINESRDKKKRIGNRSDSAGQADHKKVVYRMGDYPGCPYSH